MISNLFSLFGEKARTFHHFYISQKSLTQYITLLEAQIRFHIATTKSHYYVLKRLVLNLKIFFFV